MKVLLPIILAAFPAWSSPTPTAAPKSLGECFQAALTRSETLANQQELVKQAEENYSQAIGSILPNISGVGVYQWQQGQPGGVSGTLFPNPSHSARITATQPLFQGFKEFAGLKMTKALVGASDYDRKQAATQLYLDTAASYFNVLSVERDLEDLQEEVDLYDKRVADLKQFKAIGRSRASEVLTAQSAQATLKAQIQQSRGQLRAQREVLAFLTGFDPGVPLQKAGTSADAKPLSSYLERLERRPDVQAEMQRVKAAEENIPVARSGHFPTLGATGDYYLDRTGGQRDIHWDVGLTLTVPIFSGGIVSSQVAQAVSKRDQAENTLNRVKRQALQQIRTFHSNWLSDKSQFDAFREAADLAEKNYREETREYKLGLVTNLDVLQALTSYQDTRRSFDRARHAMMLDLENLEAAAALRLDTAR